MEIINEMWYGSLNVQDNALRETSESKHLWHLIENNREELEKSLTESQKEMLEEFIECFDELSMLNERKVFNYAFRLGVQLMTECFEEVLI